MISASPQILRPARLVVTGLSSGPSNNNSGIPEADSRDLETETGSLETELRAHGIHDTLETGLSRMPRSLVAPRGAAGGFPLSEKPKCFQYFDLEA